MNLQSKKTQTALNLITGLVTMLISFATSFFLSPFIVRTLGPEANGFSQLAGQFVSYASLLAIAFNSMSGRFITIAYHRGDKEQAQGFYSTTWAINLIMCALFIPAAIYVVLNIRDVVVIESASPTDVKILFACVFLNYFLGLITSLYSVALFVKNSLFYGNIIGMCTTLLNALLLLAAFTFLPARIFYVSFVGLLLTLAVFPINIKLCEKLTPELNFDRRKVSWSYVKNLFFAGIWNTVNQCGHILNTGLDLLLANWFVSPFLMGVLAVSKSVPGMISSISVNINNSFSPSITQTWARGTRDVLLKELGTCMKISMLLVSIPLVTFCCFGYYFYRLWQPTLDAEQLTILSVLGCMAYIPVAGTQTLYNVYTAANKLKVNSVSFIVTGFLNIVVLYFCLKYFPQYGIFAIAGISTTLSILRNMTVTLPYTASLLGLRWYAFYRIVGITLICCLMNVFISKVIILAMSPDTWLMLITAVLCSVVITFAAEAYFILNGDEREILFKMLRRLYGKR